MNTAQPLIFTVFTAAAANGHPQVEHIIVYVYLYIYYIYMIGTYTYTYRHTHTFAISIAQHLIFTVFTAAAAN